MATVYAFNSSNVTDSFVYYLKPIRDKEFHEKKLRRLRRDLKTGYETVDHIDSDYINSRVNLHQSQKRSLANSAGGLPEGIDFPMDYIYFEDGKKESDHIIYMNESDSYNPYHRSK